MSADREGRRLDLIVGAFVAALIVGGAAVILILSAQRHVFQGRVRLHATFDAVGGLRQGAPVWLSGVSVGTVTRIAFVEAGKRNRVRVDLDLTRASFDRVRRDSVARIGAQGLLGDKILEIDLGSPDSPPVEPGDELATQAPADFDRLLAQASDVLKKAQQITTDVTTVMDALADPRTIADLRGSIASLRKLMLATERGPGLAHAIFYDRRTAENFQQLTDRLAQLSAHVDHGVRELDRILDAVDDDGAQVLNQVSRAAKSVGETAGDIHRSKLVGNLERASSDLAQVTQKLSSGQGTLGALITDPTVYEQLVTVLGGVARSRILRALVRFAIKKDDGHGTGRAVDEKIQPANVRPSPLPPPERKKSNSPGQL